MNIRKMWDFNASFAPVFLIWSRRDLLLSTVTVALRQRYAGVTLGMAWLILGPILLLALYSAIYLIIFRVRPAKMDAEIYVLYIFTGLVPFVSFSQGLVQGTIALSADRDILLNTVFPAELVPLREVMVSVVNMGAGLAIIAVLAMILGRFSLAWLMVPFVITLLLMFLTGIVWVLSLANLVLKDIQQILTYVTLMLMVASPIAYTPDMLPASLNVLIYFNPLAYFIICLQSTIVLGTLPAWPILVGVVVMGLGSFFTGAWIFNRAKTALFDYA